eukprot:5337146-Pyramimonas_sp.AAC.1
MNDQDQEAEPAVVIEGAEHAAVIPGGDVAEDGERGGREAGGDAQSPNAAMPDTMAVDAQLPSTLVEAPDGTQQYEPGAWNDADDLFDGESGPSEKRRRLTDKTPEGEAVEIH